MSFENKFSRFELEKIALIYSHFSRPNALYERQGSLSLNISIDHTYKENDKYLTVTLKVISHDHGPNTERLDIEVKAEAIFVISDSVTDDELNIIFFSKVNAPAIIYPFIRQHISYLSLQAGTVNPILLPIVNFVELEKQNKNSTSS